MFDYAQTAQDAHDAIVEAGGADPGVTFTRKDGGAYVPGTGAVSGGAVVSWPGVGLVFEYGRVDTGDATHKDTLILAGDKQLILSPLDASGAALRPPKAQDKCVAPDGETYTVVNVKPLAPAGVAVMFDVNLRR